MRIKNVQISFEDIYNHVSDSMEKQDCKLVSLLTNTSTLTNLSLTNLNVRSINVWGAHAFIISTVFFGLNSIAHFALLLQVKADIYYKKYECSLSW